MEDKYQDDQISELLDVVSVLDPCDYLDEISLDTLRNRREEEILKLPEHQNTEGSSSSSATSENEPPPAKKKLSSWLKESKQKKSITSQPEDARERTKKEIDRYEKALQADSDSNPLV